MYESSNQANKSSNQGIHPSAAAEAAAEEERVAEAATHEVDSDDESVVKSIHPSMS